MMYDHVTAVNCPAHGVVGGSILIPFSSSLLTSSATASLGVMTVVSVPTTLIPSDFLLAYGSAFLLVVVEGAESLLSSSSGFLAAAILIFEDEANLGGIVRQLTGRRDGM